METKLPEELKREIEERQKGMTETERLKMNTEVQSALEKAEEIHKFLKVRMLMRRSMNKWSWRLLGVSLLCLLASIIFDFNDYDTTSLVFNGLWLLFFIAHLFTETLKARAEGQLDGAFEMMRLLGHLEDEDCDCDNCKPKGKKRRKAKSWLARPKEFFERVTKSKEAYGV